MGVLVKCSKCRAQLQAPQGATSIRCSYCHTVTRTTTPHPPPLRRPRKKAVICGINYKDSDAELSGCIRDAKSIKHLLVNRFNFLESHIHFLTEEERDPSRKPTKRNIRNAMAWLVDGVGAGDSLVFYFSGHGNQVKDQNGDEADGYDEYIWPLDYQQNGKISDDEINKTIVKPIPPGAKLTAIIDSCSSGTMLDLPCLYWPNRKGQNDWKDNSARNRVWKGTSGGEAIAISGCADHDESAETPWESNKCGAMTYCFLQAIEKGQATTYGSLLIAMKKAVRNIKEYDEDGNLVPLTQEPQLTANKRFDIFAKLFSL
ncbi:hypothetical protein RND81_13G061600 [Saponaria officinalis]|uniref:Uncharacterized protein n=1 Tax=Saponaria officinalis TaxID=3572 RepID=A0AAW1GWL9_SAPOF